VKFDPTKYGALAWGTISVALTLAIEQHKVRELALNTSAFLTDLLVRYATYERLYRSDVNVKPSDSLTHFENMLVDVYKAVLVYTGQVNLYTKEWGIG
jgi:hypothetical protein